MQSHHAHTRQPPRPQAHTSMVIIAHLRQPCVRLLLLQVLEDSKRRLETMEELARQARALVQLGHDMLDQQQQQRQARPPPHAQAATSAPSAGSPGRLLRPPSAPSGSPRLSQNFIEPPSQRRHSESSGKPPSTPVCDSVPFRLDTLVPHVLLEATTRAASRAVAKDADALGARGVGEGKREVKASTARQARRHHSLRSSLFPLEIERIVRKSVTCAVRQLVLRHFEAPDSRILDDVLFTYRIAASASTLVTTLLAKLRQEPDKAAAHLEVGRSLEWDDLFPFGRAPTLLQVWLLLQLLTTLSPALRLSGCGSCIAGQM